MAVLGTNGNDFITDKNINNDVVYALDGDDFIYVGSNDTLYGGNGDDTFYITGGNNFFYGEAGDDTMWGNAGNDVLYGGSGNDNIFDTFGNNTLIGGAGNDLLFGGSDDDVFLYNRGDGQDNVFDFGLTSASNNDTIVFGPTISLSDLSFVTRFSSELKIVLNGGFDQLTLGSQLDDHSGLSPSIEKLQFDDGTTVLMTSLLHRIIYQGTSGDDNTLFATNAGNLMQGYAGNDTLNGGTGNDTLDGGEGNDLLNGGEGNDTYLFSTNWGEDTIVDTGGVDLLNFAGSIDNLIINLDTGLAAGTLFGTNNVTWTPNTLEDVYGGRGNDIIDGDGASNNIWGREGNDSLHGAAGNDLLNGGAGNDLLDGGAGNDRYLFYNNWGNDIIVDASGTDMVDFSPTSVNVAVNLDAGAGNEAASGSNTVNWTGNIIERAVGGAGDDNLIGNTDSNMLWGNAGNDFLNGGQGNDTLFGGAGNDTYQFKLGDGVDSVNENDPTPGGIDTVQFNNSVLSNHVAFFRTGNNLQIGYTDNASDLITINNQFIPAGTIERFRLSNGQFITASEMNQVIQSMASYAASHGQSFSNLSDVKNNPNLLNIIANTWHS